MITDLHNVVIYRADAERSESWPEAVRRMGELVPEVRMQRVWSGDFRLDWDVDD